MNKKVKFYAFPLELMKRLEGLLNLVLFPATAKSNKVSYSCIRITPVCEWFVGEEGSQRINPDTELRSSSFQFYYIGSKKFWREVIPAAANEALCRSLSCTSLGVL